jgi:iron complex transport system substrate-binding protein
MKKLFFGTVLFAMVLVAVSGLAQVQYPMTVKHDLGESKINAQPKRIVVYSEEVAEIAHVLGVKPVGYVSRRATGTTLGAPVQDLNSSIAKSLRGATWLGLVSAPSLETMLALRPDLILAFTGEGAYLRGDGYKNFSSIAPTLAYSFDVSKNISWADTLKDVGRVLNLETRANNYLRSYDSKLELLKAGFEPIVKRSPKITLLFMPNPNVTALLGEKHPFGLVLTKLGFTLSLPAGASIANGSSAPISAEGLTKIEADITIALRLQNPDGTISPVPNEAVLAKLKTKYIPYSLPPLEPSSGPVTDLMRAETILRALR